MKNPFRLLVIPLVLTVTQIAWTGGYDFSGNGGGIPENNIRYAYHHLHKFLDDYLETCKIRMCNTSGSELRDIVKIKEVAFHFSFNADGLHLCSQDDCPVTFITKPNENHRAFVVKGGRIYANIPQFYADDGKVGTFLPEIVSLLTHEFGHLAGFSDHEYLDYLGGKIRSFTERKPFESELPFLPQGVSISAYLFNFDLTPQQRPDLVLNVGSGQFLLSRPIEKSIENEFLARPETQSFCPLNSARYFYKYEIENLSWPLSNQLLSDLTNRIDSVVAMRASLKLSCYSISDSGNTIEHIHDQYFHDFRIDFSVRFSEDGQPSSSTDLIRVNLTAPRHKK